MAVTVFLWPVLEIETCRFHSCHSGKGCRRQRSRPQQREGERERGEGRGERESLSLQ